MSYSVDDGAHGRTFMHTNDVNDDPSNSRRPSLQTITPVALIFSWLLFDGTTRKCIIRRSPTAIVIKVLRLESRLPPPLSLPLFPSVSLPSFLSRATSSCHPVLSPVPPQCYVVLHLARPPLSLHFRTSGRPRYSNSEINYGQKRAFVRKAWSRSSGRRR